MLEKDKISISDGNSKMGRIASVSLPAIITCRKECPCFKKCYAAKIERLRPNVKAAYLRNWEILKRDPELYWWQVEAEIMTQAFFRFHVSGDIPDRNYFEKMVEVSQRRRRCEILCFTKKFEIVNQFITDGGEIPQNLHMTLSPWKGLVMENPYCLPEAHVRYKDGTTTARPDAKVCNGNCAGCARAAVNCWVLKRGEQIVVDEH